MRNIVFNADIEGKSQQGYSGSLQFDTKSNQIEFNLYKKGKKIEEYDGWNVYPTYQRKLDGAVINGPSAEISGSQALIEVPDNVFYNEGDQVYVQFVFTDGEKLLGLPDALVIKVTKKIEGEDVEEDDRLPILDQLILEVEALIVTVEELEATYDPRLTAAEEKIDVLEDKVEVLEADIEQKQYSLDSRLVYAFEPHKRNIENLEHGMYVKNPLTNGDGTIKSEDADSMAGVFNDDDKNFYCGEGYENLIDKNNSASQATFEIEGYNIKVFSGSDSETTKTIRFFNVLSVSGENYTVSWKVVKNEENFRRIRFYSDAFGQDYYYGDKEGSETHQATVDNATFFVGIEMATTTPENDSFEIEFSITQTSQPVPFVKDTAPEGKLIIKEPWTSETHSFIFVDAEFEDSSSIRLGTTKNDMGRGSGEMYSFDPIGKPSPADAFYSNVSNVIKYNDDSEEVMIVINKGLSDEGVWSPLYATYGTDLSRFSSIGSVFIYEGELTETELRNELEKIKSGQYYVPNTGVYEPVQGAERRYNEYGQAKNFVYITSTNTDIQLVEESKRVYTEDTTGAMFVDIIDNVGAITGAGKIVDVDGYIRTTEANLKIRIEKEQL